MADNAAQARRLAEALPCDGLRWQTYPNVDQLLRHLQQATSRQPAAGTGHHPRLGCASSARRIGIRNIRAVAVADTASLQQACEQLDVNLLVLDPSRLTEADLLTISRMYLRQLAARRGSPYITGGDDMRIAKVIGTVTLSRWHPNFQRSPVQAGRAAVAGRAQDDRPSRQPNRWSFTTNWAPESVTRSC